VRERSGNLRRLRERHAYFVNLVRDNTRVSALEKRLCRLAQFLQAGKCSCRIGETTLYHNPRELEAILQSVCPVHGFRDVGELMWAGSALPLRGEDQQFCSCLQSSIREFLLGGRGPLTPAENEKEEKRWREEYGPNSEKQFCRDQQRVRKLIQVYEFEKSRRGD
jgi:hypothetical protein